MQSKSSDQELVQAIVEKLVNVQDAQSIAGYDENDNAIRLLLRILDLREVPAEVWQLTSLQELSLFGNQLTQLPPEIGQLTNLQTLSLFGNQLTQLPPEIGQLTNLQTLDLSENQLREIPAEVWQLTSLQTLYLYESQLREIPAEIGHLTSLQKLSLFGNRLTKVPAEVWQLTSLQELYLYRNQLREIPAEIGQLTSLQTLFLSENQLREIPAEIGQLTSLQELSLYGNQLTQLPPEIGQLTSLQTLSLYGNQLREIPAEIGQLTSLQTLYLSGNQLREIPAEIGQLTSLQTLYLSGNHLTQLPLEIGQLSNLQKLELSNNPDLLTPPVEIIEQGTEAILTFLQELQVNSFIRYEAKLLVVGEGGTGKSSLLKSMRNEDFDSQLSTTHGIAVSQLRVSHPTLLQTEIILNTWDFGGQHIYHATHQFFLTKRSLYLVVWNARLGAEQGRLHFWLDTIKSLAPDAPILLVATHTDERVPDLNYQLYKDAYPQLAGTFNVSNKDGIGLEDLKAGIAHHAMAIGLVGQPWPTKWIEVEKALLARKEHHISADRYTRICARRRIQAKMAQGTLGGYLHDLGKILYFRDDYILSNLVVLKPNWVTKAISRVLEDSDTDKAKGILAHTDLPRIWATDDDGTSYEPHLYPIFLRLMERFDLSYQIDPEKPSNPSNRSLIPQLLPHQPPENIPSWPQLPIGRQTYVEMRYRFDFVPAGIMPWFIVRTHRYTQNMHWREGVILKYQDHTARVELNPMLRELRLVVWGAQPHNFFTILMNTLDLILDRFEGLRIQREIPCICYWQSEKHTHCPNFFRYELLIPRMDAKRYEVECPESFRMVSVPELLYGIHTSTNDQVIADIRQSQQELMQGQKQILEISTEMATFLKELNQRAELIWRALLRQWNFEMKNMETECPSIFFLTLTRKEDFTSQSWVQRLVQESKRRFNPQNWVSQEYGLYLICQHPSDPHPVGEGYSLREAKDWWVSLNPWLNYLVSFLKVAIPVGKAFGDLYDTIDFAHMSHQIALMEEITKNIPTLANLDTLDGGVPEPHLNHDQQVIGPALRALHSFLNKVDSDHIWGGLYKTVTLDGNILWVCNTHRQQYEAKPLDERYLK